MLLNHYRFTNYSGSPRRGLIHSRFGGLGNHRYATGFGGDVRQSWESIKFMVYFTATASNVLFGYWAQEMMNADGRTDQDELFTRVMQMGAWGPIYTNWGNSGSNDFLWAMAQPFLNATRVVLQDRAQTVPYRYTLAREAHESGVSPLR